ncbi:MAG: ABC transporter ATP-binding protein [Candidatus Saccharimonadaceae bacterium]
MQKETLKIFWRFSNRYKLKRALALITPMLAVLINGIIAPYILSAFINRLQDGGVTLENSIGLIAGYGVLVFIGEVIVWRLALYFCWTFEIQSMRDLYLAIFHKLSNESLSFHANRFGGSLVSQSSKMIGSFERFWDMIIWNIVPMTSTIIGSIVILTVLSLWQYALFLLVISVAFIFTVIISSRFLAKRNTLESQASTKTSGYLADVITNIATVKAFGGEKHEYEKAGNYVDDWKAKSFHLKWAVIGTTSAYATLLALINTSALFFAAAAADSGSVEIGTIYLVFVYSLNVGRQLWEMNSIVRTYNRVAGDAHDMTEMMELPYDLQDSADKKLVANDGRIDFENVGFTHDNGEGEEVFDNFNLAIPRGQRVGLVGRSGSGKTTLTRILLRFSDVQTGAIYIDGQNISNVSQQSLHEAIAYVPQEPLLFHRSLHENIAYGRPKATRKQVTDAAKRAHAWEFISKLPDGLDTKVGERGVKLSGGQRQRIAIARAILKNAPILVLDEATSALDSESEKLIQASLSELMDNRTSIVIAHRLSTIAKLDRIIVLDDGRIVEDGTHAELIKLGGAYARLWQHQSGGFIEE